MYVALSAPVLLHRGVLSAPLGSVRAGEASLCERCYWRTKLADDGVAGDERHIKIAGLLTMLSVRLNSKNGSSWAPRAKRVGKRAIQMHEVP